MSVMRKLSHKQILKLSHDYEATANALNLVYVSDHDIGILRLKRGDGFSYVLNKDTIKDKNTIDRIKKLVIPPAWENVWICPIPEGHIQATGYDAKKRKQYRYHALWNYLRSETKFHRMIEFGKVLPALRLQLEKDIEQKELNATKVIAAVISLMERTYIRIGNDDYEKLYGSYGLTTMHDRHVNITGNTMKFSFKGKKGVYHNISLKNKRLAKIVKDCRDIPGKELFQYYDEAGNRKSIDSSCVNEYIKACTGGDFTAKDFRTWAGSLNALRAFAVMEEAEDDKTVKANVINVLDQVCEKLGNTRTVCKKYYVHPVIIQLYEERKLDNYLKHLNQIEKNDLKADLTPDEKVLMKILESNSTPINPEVIADLKKA